ncbi:MAG: DNA-formamidopyrimidine glycosylase, partial [Patescibacteria group bacterium]
MPELPEVETIKNFLIKKLLEKKILNVEIFSRKQFIGDKKKIRGEKIKEIKRRGKLLIFILEKYALLIHLKMTGQLIFSENKEKIKSTRVIFKLDNGYLIFNDARKFA